MPILKSILTIKSCSLRCLISPSPSPWKLACICELRITLHVKLRRLICVQLISWNEIAKCARPFLNGFYSIFPWQKFAVFNDDMNVNTTLMQAWAKSFLIPIWFINSQSGDGIFLSGFCPYIFILFLFLFSKSMKTCDNINDCDNPCRGTTGNTFTPCWHACVFTHTWVHDKLNTPVTQ